MNNIRKMYLAEYINPGVIILSILYLVINHDVLYDLFQKWSAQNFNGTYSHGPLVALIVVYVIFKIIQKLKDNLKVQPSILGLFALLGSQGLLFISSLADVNFLQHLLIVISLVAIVWSIYSYGVAKLFIMPATLFIMSFPVWGDAAKPLQKVAIFFTNIFLSFTWLPYYREQALFYFPNGVIEIAPECAGLQQLLVSLIIGLLFSMQNKLRLLDAIKTLVYISLASIFINTIRIIIIMFVGYYTKMESSLITKHILLGWVIYGIGIYVFLYFYSRVTFKSNLDAGDAGFQYPSIKIAKNQSAIYFLAVLVLILMPNALIALITHKINAREINPIRYSITAADWKKTSNTLNIDWKPAYPVGDSLAVGEYSNNKAMIYLYISQYSQLSRSVEPANMLNRPYNKDQWSLHKHEILPVHTLDGHSDQVILDSLTSRNNEHLLVLNYYLVNGIVTDSLVHTKLAILFGVLKLKYDTKVICLAIKSDSNVEASKAALIDFYKALKIY